MGDTQAKRPPRTRNAAATRAAILAAARIAFTQEGYEHVGVREIGAAAGVDAALVIRYFGSKERLFAAVMAEQFDASSWFAGERATVGARLARYLLTKEADTGAFDPLYLLLRSAPNPQAAALLRADMDVRFLRPLADWLGGADAPVRAELIVAYLIGIAMLREVVRSDLLAADDTERAIALVGPVLQGYIDGATG